MTPRCSRKVSRLINVERGDISTLRRSCTDGILTSFRTRIHSRPKNEASRWTLHGYIGSPWIVSTRIGMLQQKKSVIMQSVVRLRSIQSLRKFIKGVGGQEHAITKGSENEQKRIVEYVVLQKTIIEGEENPWMFWGTTQESKLENVLGEENPAGSPSMGNS